MSTPDGRQIGIEQARAVLGDLADEVAANGTPIVLTRHRKPLATITPLENAVDTMPDLSEHTRIAIAQLVDATIEHEYGRDTGLVTARQTAHAALAEDLRPTHAGAGLDSYTHITLRILVRDGMATRTCQCRQLHPLGCPHGSASGSIWCTNHYESDVPALRGALLCGTCHVAEYQAEDVHMYVPSEQS